MKFEAIFFLVLLGACLKCNAHPHDFDLLESTYSSISSETIKALSNLNFEFRLSRSIKPILIIDCDGDVFLRGKWIGWDGRLKQRWLKP